MSYELRRVDESFFETAPLVVKSHVDLDATQDAVWAILGGDRMWSWVPFAIDRLTWVTPRPRAVGATRTLRLGKVVTLQEEFFRWDDDARRASFHVTRASRRVASALAEDFQVEAAPDGRTRLTWTMAVEPRRKAPFPLSPLAPLLAPGNTFAIAGIKKVLPS